MKFRSQKRSTRKILLRRFPGIFLSVLLIGLLAFLLGWSSLLSLKNLSILGSGHQETIQAVQESVNQTKPSIKIGTPMARIDVASLRRQILENEWLSRVAISRNWLHGELHIKVVERLPVASYITTSGGSRYFDESGFDFQSPVAYSNIPSIDLTSTNRHAKEVIAQFLSSLSADLLAKAQSFSVTASSEIEMKLMWSPKRVVTVLWGDSQDIALKEEIFTKLISRKENEKSSLFNLIDPLTPITK